MTSSPTYYTNPEPNSRLVDVRDFVDSQSRLPYPPGYLASQVDLSGATADDPPYLNGAQYVENLLRGRVDRALEDWHPDAPENGWSDFWPALGETVAGTSYLEQRAKPHLNSDSERSGWADDPVKTCGKSAIGRFAMTGTDATGTHQVAKVLVCGREWCSRCGDNSGPGYVGSDAHQRRIARWLPKAQQMESMGYFVLTVPPDLRRYLRAPENLSKINRNLTRLMKRAGFVRGLRRWHWFGEEENAAPGEAPVYHPHQNLLVEGGWLSPEKLESIKDSWSKLLRNQLGLDYTPITVIHYNYVTRPAQMYHKLRYVTRATFQELQWDEYMGRQLLGFRNAQAWGTWKGEALWQPEPEDDAPSESAQALAAGNCPDCGDGSPIEWHPRIIRAAVLDHSDWRHMGAGYYVRDLE